MTSETFGHVGSYAVDGPVFGQPLIATGIDIAHIGRHDALYITTANNFVYAFDANDVSATPLWQRSLTDLPNGNSASVTGILSTPVIDRTTNSIYVVAGLMEGTDARFVLHALDLADGSDKQAEPVVIDGSVRVDDSSVSFQPSNRRIAVQRAGLAIAQNKVIVAFGGDFFEGWVFAYDKSNLKAPPAVFCTTCASRSKAVSRVDYLDSTCTLLGPGGGIWQSGRGPVVDANGKVYFFTGNKQHVIKDGCIIPSSDNACAKCSADEGCVCKGNRSSKACRGPDACIANGAKDSKVFDTNEALIQLDSGAGLKLTAWFRPENWNASGVNGLEFNDLDLGGSGPVLIPNTNRIIGGGKQGVMYVLDTTRSSASCAPSLSETCMPAPLQSFQIAPIPPAPKEFYRQILGGPVL
ncbi:MAG: hypothetical protein ABIP64_15645, partial [Burkholderiales bacterium]